MNIGGDYRKKNNSYIYMPPKYNPNICKPPSTNPVILTYPSKEVYDKINNAINLISNGVIVASKRGAFTKQETSMLTKAMKTLTTHPDTWC
jgi:hypothetical protein